MEHENDLNPAELENNESSIRNTENESTEETTAIEAEVIEDVAQNTEEEDAESLSELFVELKDLTPSEMADHAKKIYETLQNRAKVSFKPVMQQMNDMKEAVLQNERALREELKSKFVEANNTEEGFEHKRSEVTETFFDFFKKVNEFKKGYFDKLESEKQNNLKAKLQIIEDLRSLVSEGNTDVSISADARRKRDFEQVKALKERWTSIGQVPSGDHVDLNKNYSALLDQFYNNKSMEREIQEYGQKRNLELKLEICEKAEELQSMENLADAVNQLNKLHVEFKKIGHVPREEQENIWNRFKQTSDIIYERRRSQQEEQKKEMEANMRLKQELCLKVEPYAVFQSDRITEWNEKSQEILELQKQWDAIGPAPHEVAKAINKQFWKDFKGFFGNKNAFFAKLDEERNTNLNKKIALCEEAESLKESVDWDAATQRMKEMQAEWKNVGPVPNKQRDAVFFRFKTACDAFFERKRNRGVEEEKIQESKIKAKNDELKSFEERLDKEEVDKSSVVTFLKDWYKMGQATRRNIQQMQSKLDTVIDKAVEKFHDAGDFAQEKINLLMEVVQESPEAADSLSSQKPALQKKISVLESEIELLQNNLAFFAKSKTADKLKAEFETKITVAQKEIDALRHQLQTIQKVENAAKEATNSQA